jgi:predicted ATPase
MDLQQRRLVVMTGGPGSGKSTLIEALARRGFARSVEAGRAIIRDQMAIDGPALPWRDRALFAEAMLTWELRSYDLARAERGTVFFDRGVPDVIGYLEVCGLPVPDHMRRAADLFRYRRLVFVAPPWPEIFGQDAERKQDFAEAVRTHDAMTRTYTAQGYDLAELPRGPVEDRVAFVLARLASDEAVHAPIRS